MDSFLEEYQFVVDFGQAEHSPLWHGQSTIVIASYGRLQLCVTRDCRVFTWDGRELAVLAPEVPLTVWSAAADDLLARLTAGAAGRVITYRYFKKLCSAAVALRAAELM